ncbi:hypothetical protein ES708_15756 [subsurface metagenome]
MILMYSRRKRFNFGRTFDRTNDAEEKIEGISSMLGTTKNQGGGAFSDICEYCGKLASDILNHLKISHPKKYQKLVFETPE